MHQMANWDDYRLILALSRSGTIRGAATLLGVTHSTVSRRLSVINQQHGGIVFERVTGGYQTTELGRRMVDAAQRMEEIDLSADRQQRAIETELSGPVTLSLPDALAEHLLLDPIGEFCQRHPKIDLTIYSSYQFADLDRSEADIVVRGVDAPPDHYVGRRLFPYMLCHYCRADYLVKTLPEDRRWISGSYNGGRPDWISASSFPDAPIILALDDIDLRHKAALSGLGMIRTACYIADPNPAFARLPDAKPEAAQDFWVLTHPDLKDTPRIKALMRYIIGVMTDHKDLLQGRSTGSTAG